MQPLDIRDLFILLIEPSVTQAKIVQGQLKEQGVGKIDLASSGQEGFEILDHYMPDLVISSMYLPDMTAVDLLTQLRIEPRYHDLPFILVSSETRLKELEPVRQAGVVAILPKPFNFGDLQRALRATLQYLEPSEIELENYEVERLSVLLVDDSLLARRHIRRVLNDMGIKKITEASNGREGAEILSDNDFDLVITDYNMPVMDGESLTNFIRNELDNPFLPIVLVTSEQNRAKLSALQQAGLSAICDKPFEPANIRNLLRHCLEG